MTISWNLTVYDLKEQSLSPRKTEKSLWTYCKQGTRPKNLGGFQAIKHENFESGVEEQTTTSGPKEKTNKDVATRKEGN